MLLEKAYSSDVGFSYWLCTNMQYITNVKGLCYMTVLQPTKLVYVECASSSLM